MPGMAAVTGTHLLFRVASAVWSFRALTFISFALPKPSTSQRGAPWVKSSGHLEALSVGTLSTNEYDF